MHGPHKGERSEVSPHALSLLVLQLFSSLFFISCLRDVIQSSHSYLNPPPHPSSETRGRRTFDRNSERTEPKPMCVPLIDPPFFFALYLFFFLFWPPRSNLGKLQPLVGPNSKECGTGPLVSPMHGSSHGTIMEKWKRKKTSTASFSDTVSLRSRSRSPYGNFPTSLQPSPSPFLSLSQPVSARAVWSVRLGRNPEAVTMLLAITAAPTSNVSDLYNISTGGCKLFFSF
ncbi:hypothetical protein CGRA01v4_02330 [Colletotrichum graminicola]|nr:hypothetical protein CGRA01v4_02330 [Colletotrichum graminicola]